MPRQSSKRPRERLNELARKVGCHLGTVGDIERLAGINTQSSSERKVLWDQFQHLISGPTQAWVDAVMDHCSAIAIQRINAGQLSLIRTRY